jgi:hypothetical protein
MQQQHLPVSAEVHCLSVSPKVGDQKTAVSVTTDQETDLNLSELDICGLAGLSTA